MTALETVFAGGIVFLVVGLTLLAFLVGRIVGARSEAQWIIEQEAERLARLTDDDPTRPIEYRPGRRSHRRR